MNSKTSTPTDKTPMLLRILTDNASMLLRILTDNTSMLHRILTKGFRRLST